jgi:hypothetical protein
MTKQMVSKSGRDRNPTPTATKDINPSGGGDCDGIAG